MATRKKATTKNTAAKKTTTRKVPAKKTAPKKATAKTTPKKASAGKTTAGKSSTSTSASKKAPTRRSAPGKASLKAPAGRKYAPRASEDVREEMHEMHRGQLHIGKSRYKVTDPKQAIAIGLAKARREGAKVPPNPNTGR